MMPGIIEIEYLGGARTVTGSSMLATCKGQKGPDIRVLLDCGLLMDRSQPETFIHNHREIITKDGKPLAPSVTAALLSHSHVDHSGRLPILTRSGFEGRIYTTHETSLLVEAMLRDTANISRTTLREIIHLLRQPKENHHSRGKGRRDIIKESRKGRKEGSTLPVSPISNDDVEKVLARVHEVELSRPFKIGKGVTATFHDAGHILGSAMTELEMGKGQDTKRIFNTHDLGNEEKQSYLGSPQMTEHEIDLLTIEATYGNREHADPETALAEIYEKIFNTLKNGGRVVIPAFALERTQEILIFLSKIIERINQELGKKIPVYVDSQLSQKITKIYNKVLNNGYLIRFGGEDPLAILNYSRFGFLNNESRLPTLYNGNREAAIIISSSGMCDAGPVREHLIHNLPNPANLVLFAGFTGVNTLASRILSASQSGYAGQLKINGEPVSLGASVHHTSAFSSHADRGQLTKFASQVPFKGPDRSNLQILIQHCTPETGKSFREELLSAIPDLSEENVKLATRGVTYRI